MTDNETREIHNYEKRDCGNCGNPCAMSMVAIHWNECVRDGFTRYWQPKEEVEE